MNAIFRSFDHVFPDLNGRTVLVTGGTGSFGRAFVRAVIDRWRPRKLIIFSRDELKQYEMAEEFSTEIYPFLRYFLGDVRDADRLEMALRGIDYVIHAAALKHVPAAEYNPLECIFTNVYGAENLVKASLRANVKKVIALSTDKAANPINLYGASKLASDKIFVAANNLSGENGTRFSVVRYGNVLGSRGSVIPLFQRLISKGVKELPVTDERMTRFWITLEQGVNFVLSSLATMVGGEIFIPKIPSMKVTDAARAIAPDLPQRMVGIRPGEKLHEVMVTEDDARWTIEMTDRYVILPNPTHNTADFSVHRGDLIGEDFRYASNTNTEWLRPADLLNVLKAGR